MSVAATKSATAFRTIGEVAEDLALPQHVLRFWETRFPQIQPLKRGGNRRYYRPADVALLRDIARMLHHEGYTIRGVQKLLESRPKGEVAAPAPETVEVPPADTVSYDLGALRIIRDRLAEGLRASRAA